MIKDILVHLPTERQLRPVVDGSVSLAARFGAHLDGIATSYVSSSMGYVTDGGAAAAVAASFEREQQRAAERSAAALSIFETEARHAGIACACRSIEDFPAEAASAIGTTARLYELAIVLQPDASLATFDNQISTEILLQSGGPVLCVPHIFRGSFKMRRIGLCWDGSRLAARALKDARPFLAKAEVVLGISINAADTLPAGASLDDVARH